MQSPVPTPIRILFVDDAEDFRRAHADLLRYDYGYTIDEAAEANEALELARSAKRPYHVALIDTTLEGRLDGIELMQALRAVQPHLDVIQLTGYGLQSRPAALRAGAYQFLSKPLDDLEYLHQLIELCAKAQQARQTLEQERGARSYVETLLQLSQKLGASLDQRAIVEVIHDHADRIMDISSIAIALLDRRQGVLRFELVIEDGKQQEPWTAPFSSLDENEGLTGYVIRNRVPLLFSDLSIQIPPVQVILRGEPARSWLGVPLLIQEDRALGAIVVQDVNKPSLYDSTDQRILMAVANMAAQALDNARLYKQMEVLNRASRRIAAISKLEELLDAVADEASELVDTRNLRIGLHEPGSKYVDIKIRYEANERQPSLRLPLERGFIGLTIRTGKPLLLKSLAENQQKKREEGLQREGPEAHSWLSVPLRSKNRIVGAIGIQDYDRTGAYDTRDQRILERLGNHLGVFIDNLMLRGEVDSLVKSQLTAIEGLQETSELMIRRELPEEEVYNTLLRTAAEVTHADRGWFLVVDAGTDQLLPKALYQVPQQVMDAAEPTLKGKVGITGYVAERKESVRIGDVTNEPLAKQWYVPIFESTRSEMCIPVLMGADNRMVGIVNLEGDMRNAFSEDDQKLVESLASAAAVTYSVALLYHKASRQQQLLEALLQADKAISSSLDVRRTLDHILVQAVQMTKFEGEPAHLGYIMLFDDDHLSFTSVHPDAVRQQLIGRVSDRIPVPKKLPPQIPDRKMGIVARVACTQEPACVGNVTQDIDYLQYHPETVSQLAIPIESGAELIGVLSLEHKKRNAFDDEDVRAMKALAEHAVHAIRNAEAFEAAEKAQEEAEARRREVERKTNELAASKAIAWTGILGSTFAHDVEGWAAAIRNSTEQLSAKLRGLPVTSEIETIIRQMRTQVARILELSGHFRLDPEDVEDQVDVHELLKLRMEKWKLLYRNYGIDWSLELDDDVDSALVQANSLVLTQALNQIVHNAASIMANESTRRLACQTRRRRGNLEILFADTGPGMSDETLDVLFKQPVARESGEPSSGIGLLIAYLIMTNYRGGISVEKTGPQGTVFRLWLPLSG